MAASQLALARGARCIAAAVMLAIGIPASAPAQTREPRVFVTAGGGVQTGGTALTDRLEWQEHVETATATVDYAGGSGQWLGGGIGIRLWRQFGVGLALSNASQSGAASVQAQIPHPFHFDRRRGIEGTTGDLTRTETGLHAQLLYVLPAAGRIRLILSAGPSRIETTQDVVTAIRFTEEYPFDTAVFQRADTRALSASAVGFNVGADAAFMFHRSFGVAGIARFTRATMDLVRPDGGRVSVEAGGFQAGAGLRLAF